MTIDNIYQQKLNDRKARLLKIADKYDQKSQQHFERCNLSEDATGIPFGQPILVGHHSERKHRRTLERADNHMRQGIECSKKANKYRNMANAIGCGGISSDDPEAIQKLQAQLNSAKESQKFMRDANVIIRRAVKKGIANAHSDGFDHYYAECCKLNLKVSIEEAISMLETNCFGNHGFAAFELRNNNANIKRLERRIAELISKKNLITTSTHIEDFCEVVKNIEENRLQLIFDGKPSETIRKALKKHGFRWAPSKGVWQRQLTNNAVHSLNHFLTIRHEL